MESIREAKTRRGLRFALPGVALIATLAAAPLAAQPLQQSRVKEMTVLSFTPTSPDTTTSTTSVPLPGTAITGLDTGAGALLISFCADVGFGPFATPTETGALDLEVYVDGGLARPGTVLLAQNVAPQAHCASFLAAVPRGSHDVVVYWRSLGGEEIHMGARTLSVLHP